MRYAVVGTSGITSLFVTAAKQTGRYTLAVVCSRSAERGAAFAEKHGAEAVVTSIEQLAVRDDVEAVYVASPNALHAAQTETLLRAGKHVLCEKTATVTAEEARRLHALADERGLVYREALMGFYLPERQRIREMLPTLGRISYARFEFSQRSSRYDAYLRGERVNIFDPTLAAGGLMDLGIYCVYPSLDLFGKPSAMHTRATLLRTGVDGCGVSLWEYPEHTVEIVWNKTGQQVAPSTIIGDNGTLTIGLMSQLGDVKVHRADGTVEVLSVPRDHASSMTFEAAAFADLVEQGNRDDGAAALQIAASEAMEAMRREIGLKF